MLTKEQTQWLLSLQGWCPEEKMQRMNKLVLDCGEHEHFVKVVELGVWAGRSLFPMAFALKELGKGIAVGLDAWSNEVAVEGTNNPEDVEWWSKVDMNFILNEFKRGIAFAELDNFINWRMGRTYEVPAGIEDESISVIHQDSGHNVETITAELDAWIPKLKMGGYIICDDVQWTAAKPGYDKLPNYGLELIEDYETWQIWRKVR